MNYDARFPVGLEQGPDGSTLVHSLSIPGCVSAGATPEEAVERFPQALSRWLSFLQSSGERVPTAEQELEVTVDEWIESDADVAAGESTVCFEADLSPLTATETATGLRRLGDLRGHLLRLLRETPEEALQRTIGSGLSLRKTIDELARAQWWTLSRLGASPLAEVPDKLMGRLDTAMALAVELLGNLPDDARGRLLELEGEEWTPRKVLRRLLWLEWSAGRVLAQALAQPRTMETG